MKPLVSVIVPVYKVEDCLSRCLDSLCSQTLRDIDIILVDDASPDRCGSICEEYAAKDSRICVFHIEHSGISGARNFGIQKAMDTDSKYIAFVDSDDWLEKNMYELLVDAIEKSKSDIAICGFYYEYEKQRVNSRTIDKQFHNCLDILKAQMKVDYVDEDVVWNKLFKKECFDVICFPKGRVFEEHATLYKIFSETDSVISIPQKLYHYRIREGSISHTRTMKHLVDFWTAYKARYYFFKCDNRFNYDNDLLRDSLYLCAYAIARTWRWYYVVPNLERKKYARQMDEMRNFALQHFSGFGEKNWSLHVRLCISLVRYDSELVFAFLYYLNQFYRKLRKSVLQK